MGGQPEGEVASGGVSGYYGSGGVEIRNLGEVLGPGSDVFEGSWVASSRLADAAVFETPGGVACFGDGSAEVGGVGQVVLRLPETSVDEDDDWVGARACGETEFSELVGVGAVGYALAGRWGRQVED